MRSVVPIRHLEMADQLAIGWILTAAIAAVALYSLVLKKDKSRLSPANETECVKSVAVDSNGKSDADVIIVGAGVAGAALAYTLGKVNCFLNLFSIV